MMKRLVYSALAIFCFAVVSCTNEVPTLDYGEDYIVLNVFNSPMRYIQVAVSVANEEKLKQELAALKLINDNYPKYILTMDEVFVPDHNGVRTINIIDFLLGGKDLD